MQDPHEWNKRARERKKADQNFKNKNLSFSILKCDITQYQLERYRLVHDRSNSTWIARANRFFPLADCDLWTFEWCAALLIKWQIYCRFIVVAFIVDSFHVPFVLTCFLFGRNLRISTIYVPRNSNHRKQKKLNIIFHLISSLNSSFVTIRQTPNKSLIRVWIETKTNKTFNNVVLSPSTTHSFTHRICIIDKSNWVRSRWEYYSEFLFNQIEYSVTYDRFNHHHINKICFWHCFFFLPFFLFLHQSSLRSCCWSRFLQFFVCKQVPHQLSILFIFSLSFGHGNGQNIVIESD